MSPRFHPQLINDRFGDPGVYIEFMFEKRAILFDLGDLTPLSTRKLLRISDVFVSHMHMDHFCGLDRLIRVLLGRDRRLRLYGPAGIIEAVGHKLAAYTWNLVERYGSDLVLDVAELRPGRQLRTVGFRSRTAFAPEGERIVDLESDRLLEETGFSVSAAILDHGIPCLAFALEERAHVNIWKNRVAESGLGVGSWLRNLKEAILRGDGDNTVIRARWKEDGSVRERSLPLGDLRGDIAIVTDGTKIAYVVDAAPSQDNIREILDLADSATTLYIETAFLDADADRARERNHLTARQAGEIARRAGVQKLVTLHYSPRYEGRADELKQEAERAFHHHGESVPQ